MTADEFILFLFVFLEGKGGDRTSLPSGCDGTYTPVFFKIHRTVQYKGWRYDSSNRALPSK
jgi:hypothetical protein